MELKIANILSQVAYKLSRNSRQRGTHLLQTLQDGQREVYYYT